MKPSSRDQLQLYRQCVARLESDKQSMLELRQLEQEVKNMEAALVVMGTPTELETHELFEVVAGPIQGHGGVARSIGLFVDGGAADAFAESRNSPVVPTQVQMLGPKRVVVLSTGEMHLLGESICLDVVSPEAKRLLREAALAKLTRAEMAALGIK